MRKRCGGVLSSSSLNVSKLKYLSRTTNERMNARKRTSYEEKRKNGANTTMNLYTAIAS